MATAQDLLRIDAAAECIKIGAAMRRQLLQIRRKGIVLGLSGGIDSSVTAALAVRALGPERVLGLCMPESDSDPESLELGRSVAQHLGIRHEVEDIAPVLTALKCYARRNDAVASVVPGFDASWKFKIVLAEAADNRLNYFCVVARSPAGVEVRERLPLDAYLAIVAATNFKQRVRKMVEYHAADRLNFAVAGTPNRLEFDQGFFVKQGDGAADLKPIAHLYKSQVYQLAEELDIPERIRRRPPSTDTYSLPQGQDEFYFKLPYDKMDLCLFGKNNGMTAAEIAMVAGLTPQAVERAYKEIDTKRSTTRYQHLGPLLVEEIPGVG